MNNRKIPEAVYEYIYECAMENNLLALDREGEEYPWNSLGNDMQTKLIAAMNESFDVLIESIYGGGHYNDTDMVKFANNEICGYISDILDI